MIKGLSQREEPVLYAIADITKPHGEWCVSFERIMNHMGRNDYREIRRITRALVRKGYVEYVRGLFNNGTGQLAGSGHCITVQGLRLLGEAEIQQAIEGTLTMTTYYGVYRIMKNGSHHYISRTATANEKLAKEIADDLTHGQVVTPTGRIVRVTPHPHIAKPITEIDQ